VNEWKEYRQLAKVLLEVTVPKKSRPLAVTGAGTGATCRISGKSVICGDCEAVEKRAKTEHPSHTVIVCSELRHNKDKNLKLRPEVEAAWAELVATARDDGISAQHLKIRSAFRSYSAQSRLWCDRLTGVFREMGCREPVLSCIWAAADRTNKALKILPIPHPKSTWITRFRKEFAHLNCRPNCLEGGSDSVRKAVSRLAAWTVRPGRSKHHSGRALDVSWALTIRRLTFPNSAALQPSAG
jgi:D-alanyl-D-alanine carboxypeptidase